MIPKGRKQRNTRGVLTDSEKTEVISDNRTELEDESEPQLNVETKRKGPKQGGNICANMAMQQKDDFVDSDISYLEAVFYASDE